MKSPFVYVRSVGMSAALFTLAASASTVGANTASANSTAGASPDTEKASIFASYGMINTAFCDNRISLLSCRLCPNYTQTDSQGHTLNRDGLLRKLEDERKSIQTIKTDYAITSFVQQGSGVLVEMKMHSTGTGQKRMLFFNVHGTFTNDQVVHDLWVNTPTGWQIQSRQVLLDESHQQAA